MRTREQKSRTQIRTLAKGFFAAWTDGPAGDGIANRAAGLYVDVVVGGRGEVVEMGKNQLRC